MSRHQSTWWRSLPSRVRRPLSIFHDSIFSTERPVKLIIQVSCFNEAGALVTSHDALPREGPDFSKVEWLIINGGSTDNAAALVTQLGADHVVRHQVSRGLAMARSACPRLTPRGARCRPHPGARRGSDRPADRRGRAGRRSLAACGVQLRDNYIRGRRSGAHRCWPLGDPTHRSGRNPMPARPARFFSTCRANS